MFLNLVTFSGMFLFIHLTLASILPKRFFPPFLKRHLLTLLTLNVAKHSCGSNTSASLRHTRSERFSPRSHRLTNSDVISAITFWSCAHRSRRQTHRGGRSKQHAIKVIDTGLRISSCMHARIDRLNLISVHYICSSTKAISGLRVGCFNAQSEQQNCEKMN